MVSVEDELIELEDMINVYPVAGGLQIDAKKTFLYDLNIQIFKVELYNMLGQMIYDESYNYQNRVFLPFSQKGIYIVKVLTNEKSFSLKISI